MNDERKNDVQDRMRRNARDPHGSRRAFVHVEPRYDLIIHAAMIGAATVAYLAIRYGAAPQWGGFWRDHASDLLAGITLPAITAFIAAPNTPAGAWVRSMEGRLAVALFAAFAWEVVAPRIVPGSVGDPLDALSYVVGTVVYIAISKTQIADRAHRPQPSQQG